MKDLIKALAIFLKYGDVDFPTHCEHDVMYVMVDPAKVSAEDTEELLNLHFFPSDEGNTFISYYYGRA